MALKRNDQKVNYQINGKTMDDKIIAFVVFKL